MRPRRKPLLFVVVAATATMTSGMAAAAERRCPAVGVEADEGVRAAFPDVVERIHGEFRARPDVDTCARVGLRLRDGGDIEVAVALPDGRTSSRTVSETEDVIPTLQALLLVPAPALALRSEPGQTSLIVVTPPTTPRADDSSDSKPSVPSTGERELGVELSALTGARAGDGQFAYGAGALSLVEVSEWLLGFEGRVDAYQSMGGSDPESALELALLFGRRVYFDSVALDLTFGPAVAMKGIARLAQTDSARVDSSEVPARERPPPPPYDPTTGPLPRLLVGARLGFAPRSVFRGFVGLEGEFGPQKADDGELTGREIPSPRMPRYTAGLVLGATVGTL